MQQFSFQNSVTAAVKRRDGGRWSQRAEAYLEQVRIRETNESEPSVTRRNPESCRQTQKRFHLLGQARGECQFFCVRGLGTPFLRQLLAPNQQEGKNTPSSYRRHVGAGGARARESPSAAAPIRRTAGWQRQAGLRTSRRQALTHPVIRTRKSGKHQVTDTYRYAHQFPLRDGDDALMATLKMRIAERRARCLTKNGRPL